MNDMRRTQNWQGFWDYAINHDTLKGVNQVLKASSTMVAYFLHCGVAVCEAVIQTARSGDIYIYIAQRMCRAQLSADRLSTDTIYSANIIPKRRADSQGCCLKIIMPFALLAVFTKSGTAILSHSGTTTIYGTFALFAISRFPDDLSASVG